MRKPRHLLFIEVTGFMKCQNLSWNSSLSDVINA